MDFSYVNELLHFYEPDVNLYWLHDALEQMNSTDVLVDLSIATMTCGFIIGFYRYRRSRQAKVKSPSGNCAEVIRNEELQEQCSIDRPRAAEQLPEIGLSSLADDSGLLTDDASSSSTSDASSFAQSADNANPFLADISMPEKDVSDSKENGDATSPAGDGAAKMIYKKLIQDDLNARLKLLQAEKNLFAQMKQMQNLKRSLLPSSVGHSALDNSYFNKTSIAISKRKSFFDADHTEKTFLKHSSIAGLKAEAGEDATRVKLMNLKKSISHLIDIHMNELSSLQESIAEKRLHAKKLEAMKKEIDSLYEKTEKNNKDKLLTVEEPNNKVVDSHNETAKSNLSAQEVEKSSSNSNLVNQLESIDSLKTLLKNYDNNEQELSTIMEKSREDTENSLILQNDISKLQSDLKSIKKTWSRSSTPRKSPPAVST